MRYAYLIAARSLIRLLLAAFIGGLILWMGVQMLHAYYPPAWEVVAGHLLWWLSWAVFAVLAIRAVFVIPADWARPKRNWPNDVFRRTRRRGHKLALSLWCGSMDRQLAIYRAVKKLRLEQGTDEPTMTLPDNTTLICKWPSPGQRVSSFFAFVLLGKVGDLGAHITVEQTVPESSIVTPHVTVVRLEMALFGGARLQAGRNTPGQTNPDATALAPVLDLVRGGSTDTATVTSITRPRPAP